jgi:cytochrome c oxidase assembly protein subunit 15
VAGRTVIVIKSDLYRPWLNRTAWLTAGCTFVLIFIGGLVTSKHAGMSVPDWPNSYGYNMFLFPPSKWVGGILFEHTHRLMGTVVGFCASLLTLLAWAPGKTLRGRRWILGIFAILTLMNAAGTTAMAIWPAAFHLSPPASGAWNIASQGLVSEAGMLLCTAIAFFCRQPEPRIWVRWIATACLTAICIQGLLGGMRVDLINLTLAMVHGCFAQFSFCLIILAGIVTSRWWKNAPDLSAQPKGKSLIWLAIIAVCVVYGQLIIGAVMRHLQAGLAIPDLPLAYGKLLPPMNKSQLQAANHLRVWKLGLEPVTLIQIWLHFGHRIGAIVVSCTLLTLIGVIHSKFRSRKDLVRPASVLGLLLVAQLTLGILTVYLRKPADVASSHVAVGALVLATTFFIAVRAIRLYSLGYRQPAMNARGRRGFEFIEKSTNGVAEATTAGVR